MYFYLGLSGGYISHSSNSLSIFPLNQPNSDIESLSHPTGLAGNFMSVIIKAFFLSHGSIYEPYVTFQEKGRSSVSTSLTCQNNTGHLSSQCSFEMWWLLGFMSCAGHMVNLKSLNVSGKLPPPPTLTSFLDCSHGIATRSSSQSPYTFFFLLHL